ncbi:MAG: M56 family metallopeptidase [Firmicutes bacterium]|nr:M56 family metallopeptidase [Bacillota bacterium]
MIPFRFEWLFYPQWLLALWAPLLAYLLWRTVLGRGWVTDPRTRFWATFAVSLLPPLVWFVPYLPNSAFRHLPYMVPIAWGVWQAPPEVLHAILARSLGPWLPVLQLFFNGPLLAPVAGALVALVWGGAEYLWTAVHIWQLPRYNEGGVTILRVGGPVAFTFGLLRPRVYLGEGIWHSPHRQAVLVHEQAHARRRDPLLLFMARAVRRGAWYLPFWGAVVAQLEFEGERICDEAACCQAGRAQYAQALLAVLDQWFTAASDRSPIPIPAWSTSFLGRGGRPGKSSLGSGTGTGAGTGAGGAGAGLLERVRALDAGGRQHTPGAVWVGLAVVYVLLLVLL